MSNSKKKMTISIKLLGLYVINTNSGSSGCDIANQTCYIVNLRTVENYHDIRENVKYIYNDSSYVYVMNRERKEVGLKLFSVSQGFLQSFIEENKQNRFEIFE